MYTRGAEMQRLLEKCQKEKFNRQNCPKNYGMCKMMNRNSKRRKRGR